MPPRKKQKMLPQPAVEPAAADDDSFDELDLLPSSAAARTRAKGKVVDKQDEGKAAPALKASGLKSKAAKNVKTPATPTKQSPQKQAATAQMITESPGDAYLRNISKPAGLTSDLRLSNDIDPAFTFESYAAALEEADGQLELQHGQLREWVSQQVKENGGHWMDQLEQGFSLMFYGVGSKRHLLDELAQKLASKGPVVVVRGYESSATISGLLLELESVVSGVTAAQKKDKKGKGKAKDAAPGPMHGTSEAAIEARTVRLLALLDQAEQDVFIVLHTLEGPHFRIAKALPVLANLASHKRIHLVASTDHIRSAALFSTQLAQQFAFVYYDYSTYEPFTEEVRATLALSKVLPGAVFPRLTASGLVSAELAAQAATYVLKSVPQKTRDLYRHLGDMQITALEALSAKEARAAELELMSLDASRTSSMPAPEAATAMSTFVESAVGVMVVTEASQVATLIHELFDHEAFKRSSVSSERETGEEWVWIPLAKEALVEILEKIANKEL